MIDRNFSSRLVSIDEEFVMISGERKANITVEVSVLIDYLFIKKGVSFLKWGVESQRV